MESRDRFPCSLQPTFFRNIEIILFFSAIVSNLLPSLYISPDPMPATIKPSAGEEQLKAFSFTRRLPERSSSIGVRIRMETGRTCWMPLQPWRQSKHQPH